ncbi:hypothetical protein M427DRAFT_32723 [Gonapodya prolifera JEL478]|uniref:Uncharacterized protein n=1 Tax=Gonapodya prolifera (strain JEL478) TaxID=1344416 RepID=A0A139AE19_GONPJ|nr:hypothetical protein M427DRAFT_32723 [Gonapodya prolifera JEL478]|eukprot:KXS15008.1 hypothetical protein M427DRAFT_32723 [Gonapodya prolifera JEL478]
MSSSSITSIIAKWHLQGTFMIPMNQIDLNAFTPIWEHYKPGVLKIIMVILFCIGEDHYGIVNGNHRLVAFYCLKDEGKDYKTLPRLLDRTLTVNAIILQDDMPKYVRSHIRSMANFTGKTRVPMNPFDTFMAVCHSLMYGTTNGTQRQVWDMVKDLEGTSHIKQIGNWITVAKLYTVVPNEHFFCMLVALPAPPTLKEVQDMAQLWGEKYSPWIKGYLQLSDNDRWTDKKKHEAWVLILSGTFKDTSTCAHVLPECKECLRIYHNTSRGTQWSSGPAKEGMPATPQSKHKFASPTITLIDLKKLEDTVNKFSTDKGQTANLIVLDFPSPDQADHSNPSHL